MGIYSLENKKVLFRYYLGTSIPRKKIIMSHLIDHAIPLNMYCLNGNIATGSLHNCMKASDRIVS